MFEFAWPWVFLLLPLPWLLRRLLPPAASGEAALKVSFLAELENLAGRRARPRLPDWRRQQPFVLLWLLLVLAAARPQWLGEPLPLPSSGRDLLLAVDVSGSMDYPDMRWQGQTVSRLSLVQTLLGDFIASRQGDRLGLILFGSRAYLQAPLTFDRQTVRTWLAQALEGQADGVAQRGVLAGDADLCLRQRPADSRVLILVTDGANTAGEVPPLTAARLAAGEGVRIYTIGIGADAEQAGAIGLYGLNPGLDLDEPLLREIAELSGGSYFRARSADELAAISEVLDHLEPVSQAPTQAFQATALHPWPLAAALLLSVLLASRELWPHGLALRLRRQR